MSRARDLSFLTNIITAGTNVVVGGGMSVSGILTASSFRGDGSQLTGISAGVSTGGNYWTSTSAGIHTLSNVGIATTNPQSPLQVERFGVDTGIGTFNATAGVSTDLDTFTISLTDFKTTEYTLHIQNSSGTQAEKVLIMQNGTTAYSQEYAIMYDNSLVVSAGATISSGVMKFQITPEVGISGLTTYRYTRQTML